MVESVMRSGDSHPRSAYAEQVNAVSKSFEMFFHCGH